MSARPIISFCIIGAQKCGTTSLHEYLRAHPEVYLPKEKELGFFADPDSYAQGWSFLRHHYGAAAPHLLAGLSNVGLMYLPGCATRIFKYNPAMKLVAVLRDPRDRAYSAYWYHRRTGRDPAASFAEAIERELNGRIDPTNPKEAYLAYLRNGCYLERLQPYLDLFPRENIFLVRAEHLQHERMATVRAVLNFLGVSGDIPPHALERQHNVAASARLPWLSAIIRGDTPLKRFYRSATPQRLRNWLHENIFATVIRLNERPRSYPPVDPALRHRLTEYFRPHNDRLAKFAGWDLTAWNSLSSP